MTPHQLKSVPTTSPRQRDSQYVRPAFQTRRTLAGCVRDNLTLADRRSFYQRVIFVAKHKDNSKELSKFIGNFLREKIIKAEHYSHGEHISGLIMFYDGYSVYMLEGSEEALGPFLRMVSNKHKEIYEQTKVILLFNNMNQAIVLVEIKASWLAESSNQYHIQTDEGPERYFRYQTNNGQYRKEKRLKDGTVIGTDAWIDASGLLRQKDYIADADGYRILKSRTLFVGQDQPIDNVLKNLKSFTNGVTPQKIQPIQPSVSSARARPSAVNNFIPATRPDWLYYDHPSPSPTSYHQTNSPSQRTFVSGRDDYARPTPAPTAAGYHFTKAIADDRVPSIRLEPPYKSVQPISIHSAPTVLPVASNLGTLSPSTPSPIASFTYSDTATSFLSPYPTNPSTLNTELLPPLVGPTQVSNEVDNRIDATETQNAFVSKNLEAEPQPLYTRPAAFRSSLGRNVPNGQEAGYDGAAINGNGFSYYLPRHYHEEVSDGARQAGSFGYIDPFGIRRVVYYDASPERGFLHKKNNRYVGFNATPYDPPPNE